MHQTRIPISHDPVPGNFILFLLELLYKKKKDMYDFNYIRSLENQGKWREAEQAWSRTEYKEHAQACKLLADAIQAGDEFRERDKQTVYTVLEGIRGNFFYRQGDYTIKAGERLIGYVYGIGEATDAVVALSDNKEELRRVVTGIKLDFPELN